MPQFMYHERKDDNALPPAHHAGVVIFAVLQRWLRPKCGITSARVVAHTVHAMVFADLCHNKKLRWPLKRALAFYGDPPAQLPYLNDLPSNNVDYIIAEVAYAYHRNNDLFGNTKKKRARNELRRQLDISPQPSLVLMSLVALGAPPVMSLLEQLETESDE